MEFIITMAFCIVGEGSTAFWWELLRLNHAPKMHGDMVDSDQEFVRFIAHRWKNVLLRGFIEAQAY